MEIKNSKMLITGGAGFIGSHLVDLLSDDNEIIIFDDFSSGKKENIEQHIGKKNIKIIEESILNFAALNKACENINIIYHLAVRCLRQSIEDPLENHRINATGSLNVCEAARQNNIERLIYISSSEVYGESKDDVFSENSICYPTTVYAASKLAGEYYVKAYYKTYGLPSIIIRPFNTYGPREHYEGVFGEVIPTFILRAMNDLPLVVYGDGNQIRDFTYVTEIVNGIVKASECEELIGDIVNIAYGKGISINEIADIILRILDKKELDIQRDLLRPGDTPRLQADIRKAKKLFGYNPEISIEKGIQLYIKWLYEHYKNPNTLVDKVILRSWEK